MPNDQHQAAVEAAIANAENALGQARPFMERHRQERLIPQLREAVIALGNATLHDDYDGTLEAAGRVRSLMSRLRPQPEDR